MPSNCPQCGADTSQSSGVVCPACGHILQPGADDLAHEQQVKPGRRGLRLALAFLIPFVIVRSIVHGPRGDPGILVLAIVIGALYGSSFYLASIRARTLPAQLLGSFLIFLGLLAVMAGVVFVGCSFVLG